MCHGTRARAERETNGARGFISICQRCLRTHAEPTLTHTHTHSTYVSKTHGSSSLCVCCALRIITAARARLVHNAQNTRCMRDTTSLHNGHRVDCMCSRAHRALRVLRDIITQRISSDNAVRQGTNLRAANSTLSCLVEPISSTLVSPSLNLSSLSLRSLSRSIQRTYVDAK